MAVIKPLTTMKTQNLFQIGFSRLNAAIAARERAAVAESDLEKVLSEAAAAVPAAELVLLPTCSRLEIYGAAENPEAAVAAARDWLARRGGEELLPSLRSRAGKDALGYLFRVAAGLDSWIIGESEILGQTRRAYEAARRAGKTGPTLNRVFQSAVAAGKAARAKTGIQNGVHSIGGAAALLARAIFGAAGDGQIAIFGAGEAAETSARHLSVKNFRRISVANRTPAKAQELAARVGGAGISLEEGFSLLARAEIAIFSTSSPEPLLREAALRAVLPKRERPLFLIDLGMPRNVEPSCGGLPDVFLYNLDDLKEVVARNQASKAAESVKAEAIVEEAAGDCSFELEKAAARSASLEVAAL